MKERESIKKQSLEITLKKNFAEFEQKITKSRKKDLTNFATKNDLENCLNHLENNIQQDFNRLGEIFVTKEEFKIELGKLVTDLKDHIDKRHFEVIGNSTIKYKKLVKTSKHIISVVDRNHNIKKSDQKDIAIAKETLNSII